MLQINFFKIKDDAKIPIFGHNDTTNAAVDLYSCIDKNIIIWPKSAKAVSTGIGWYVNINLLNDYLRKTKLFNKDNRNFKLAMVVQSRSGLAFNKGVEASNAGVIDESYTGEIKVKLYNNTWFPKIIKNHERIAQGIIELLPIVTIQEIHKSDVGITNRGDKGFGSSGTN